MKTITRNVCTALLGGLLAVSMASCKEDAPATPKATPATPKAACSDCGTITGIEQRKAKGEGSGVGAVVGAVAGAVIGHQVGDGKGKDAATVGGAIVGGFAGHEIEKLAKGTVYYHVTVAMEQGGTRTLDLESLNGLSNGSKVKIVGNGLQIASR